MNYEASRRTCDGAATHSLGISGLSSYRNLVIVQYCVVLGLRLNKDILKYYNMHLLSFVAFTQIEQYAYISPINNLIYLIDA